MDEYGILFLAFLNELTLRVIQGLKSNTAFYNKNWKSS